MRPLFCLNIPLWHLLTAWIKTGKSQVGKRVAVRVMYAWECLCCNIRIALMKNADVVGFAASYRRTVVGAALRIQVFQWMHKSAQFCVGSIELSPSEKRTFDTLNPRRSV